MATLISFPFNIHISYSPQRGKVEVNGRTLPLTPTEYRLLLCFLQEVLPERSRSGSSTISLLAYASKRALAEYAGIERSNSTLLRKHMSNLGKKLAPFDLYFAPYCAGGESGSLLFTQKRMDQ